MKKNNLLTTNVILSTILNVKGVYEYIIFLGDNGYKIDYKNIIKNNKEIAEELLNSKKSKLLIAKSFLNSLLPGFNIYVSRERKKLDTISKSAHIIQMSFDEIKYYHQIENNLEKIVFTIIISCNKNINPKEAFEFTNKIKENIKVKTLVVQNKICKQKKLTTNKKNND